MDTEAEKFNHVTYKEIGLFFVLGGVLVIVALGSLTLLAMGIGALV